MNRELVRDNHILIIALIILIGISIIEPSLIIKYPFYINWSTILILSSLFLVTTGIKDSGYLDKFAYEIIKRVNEERKLAFILITMSFFLSMFITNDVTLLILVPLTLSLKRFIDRDVKRIIIFEALAVNAGSALTPIGNPQNIYLWHIWNIGFYQFIFILLPAVMLMLFILIFLTLIVFPSQKIEKIDVKIKKADKPLGVLSIALLLVFILFMEIKLEFYIIIAVFIIYLIKPKVYKDVDWLLVLLFIIFFIDFTALGKIPLVCNFLKSQNLTGISAYIYAGLFSQFMSNVPSTILLSNFTHDFKSLAYGVSIGGNGTAIASLANLIALRFIKDRKIWIEFHKYSVPFFMITFILGLIFLFIV